MSEDVLERVETEEDAEIQIEMEEVKSFSVRKMIKAIQDGDYSSFCKLIDEAGHDEITRITKHAELVCVQISKYERAQFEEKIITSGLLESLLYPDLSKMLHNAIRVCDRKQVAVLCSLNANTKKPYYGVNPLFLIVKKYCKGECENELDALKIMEILISNGADVNVRGKVGYDFAPIHFAAMNEKWCLVKALLKNGALIDSEDTRNLIESKKPDLLKEYPRALTNKIIFKFQLFHLLYDNKEDEFIKKVEEEKNQPDNGFDINSEDGWYTFLQLSCTRRLSKVLEYLLKGNADPNKTSGVEYPAIVLAALQGSEDIVDTLLLSGKIKFLNVDKVHDTIIHKIAYLWTKKESSKITDNVKKCTNILLDAAIQAGVDINGLTAFNVTALKVSSSACNKDLCLMLLNHGAFCSLDADCLSNIDPKLLEEFFDSKIKLLSVPHNLLNGASVHRPMLDYSFMLPSQQNLLLINKARNGETSEKMPLISSPADDENSPSFPEMPPLCVISRSKEHQHLLKHPLISNFLQLKWLKLYYIYLANVLYYTSFTLFFSFYISSIQFFSASDMDNMTSSSTFNSSQVPINPETFKLNMPIAWYCTIILWAFIFLREMTQLVFSPIDYLKNIENWLELVLLSASILVLLNFTNNEFQKYLSAVAIIFTYVELVFLIGRHPNVAKYVTMFTRVSQKSVYMLLWFSPLIFSFAFGFHILFRHPAMSDYFQNLWSSVLKTFVMVTGEFDAGDLGFHITPGLSQAVFVSFTIFIAVILMNLLNALAVSDTQAIIDEAEILCCIAKVKLFDNIESFFWPQNKGIPGGAKKKKSCFSFSAILPSSLKKLTTLSHINVIPLNGDSETIFTILVKNPRLSYPNVTGSRFYRLFCTEILGLEFDSIVKGCCEICSRKFEAKEEAKEEEEEAENMLMSIETAMDLRFNDLKRAMGIKIEEQKISEDE